MEASKTRHESGPSKASIFWLCRQAPSTSDWPLHSPEASIVVAPHSNQDQAAGCLKSAKSWKQCPPAGRGPAAAIGRCPAPLPRPAGGPAHTSAWRRARPPWTAGGGLPGAPRLHTGRVHQQQRRLSRHAQRVWSVQLDQPSTGCQIQWPFRYLYGNTPLLSMLISG